MKTASALRFREYVRSESTGHATRSTTGAMHFTVDCHGELDVILKPVNSHSGPKLLVNELVCSELAFRLGLPCLEPIVVDVPSHMQIPLRLTDGFMRAGPNYAIPFLANSVSPPSAEHIKAAHNIGDLPGIIVFDAWIGNRDRTTPGNLLASPVPGDAGSYHIWMIDHGHGITGPDWTAARLAHEAQHVTPLPFLDVMGPSLDGDGPAHFSRWIDRIAQLSDDAIAAVLALIPHSWLPDGEERQALFAYLCQRRHCLRVDLFDLAELAL